MKRLAMAMASVFACSCEPAGGEIDAPANTESDGAGPVLRVFVTLDSGDLAVCAQIWNAGIEVIMGDVTLVPSDAVGADGQFGQWFRWDFDWPASVQAGTAGEAHFYGDGDAASYASGSATFTTMPGTFLQVPVSASCESQLPDAGP